MQAVKHGILSWLRDVAASSWSLSFGFPLKAHAERCGREVKKLASYSGGCGFKFRSGDRLS
jgi:hypothetical protein